MMTVVIRYYAALERADFKAASTYIVPEQRRRGPVSAFEVSSHYARSSDLHFESLLPAGKNSVVARYRYRGLLGQPCRGTTFVTLRTSARTWLIEKIDTLRSC